jgi:hypothetical protein
VTRVAPLLAGWWLRSGGLPAQTRGTGDVPTGDNVTVEIYVDGLWTDITPRVMTRDGSQNISISVGRSGESATINPGTCAFQLNNRDGLFSPRNPMSPYYGKIGRNTKIRVSVPNGNAKSYRFQGEIPAWPQKWDSTGTDVWVDIEAAGILRRLNQGSAPLRSTMYRGLTSPSTITTNPAIAYWPCEDAVGSTSIASAIGGGAPMRIVGTPTLASFDGFNSSAPIPVMGDSSFAGAIPGAVPFMTTNTGSIQVRFLLAIPATGATTNQRICTFTTTGTAAVYNLIYTTGGNLTLQALDSTGAVLQTMGPSAFAVDGELLRVSIELNRPDDIPVLRATLATLQPGATTGQTLSDSWLGYAVGHITSITMAPDGGLTGTAIGHVSVQGQITTIFDLGSQLAAYDGEAAGTRAARLIGEQGIAASSLGTLSDSVAMGPQTRDTLLNLLQECETADLGLLFERWTTLGLGYRVRTNIYNQAAGLELDYTAFELAEVPTPVDDDQATRNDITVTRVGGSSARATQDTGPLSTLDPPNGVGIYDTAVNVNVQRDDDLPDQAAWRLHMGTVDEARYPQITINLAHPSFTTSTTQRSDALGLHPGDRVTIANTPSWLPPGLVSLIVVGVNETIDNFQHAITLNCVPESPYRVGVTDDPTYGRVDTDGSTLTTDATTTTTALTVATNSGPVWTTDHSETPFDLRVGGEVVTVVGLGTVINDNALLLTDASGWTASNSTLTYTTAITNDGYAAAASMRVAPDGVSASGGVNTTSRSPVGSITPAASYTCCAWVYSPAGWSDLRTAVDWYDAGGGFLSTSLGSATAVAAGVWTFLTQTFTAPASASSAITRGRWGSTPAASDVSYWWAIRLIDDATVATTSPQRMTVVRSVNGIVKTQTTGTDVALAQPMIVAL